PHAPMGATTRDAPTADLPSTTFWKPTLSRAFVEQVLPNKRLKLAGADRSKGNRSVVPLTGHGLSSDTSLRRCASRPQLKRDPLGRSRPEHAHVHNIAGPHSCLRPARASVTCRVVHRRRWHELRPGSRYQHSRSSSWHTR